MELGGVYRGNPSGESQMNRYILYVLDDVGRVVDSLAFRTAQDEEACAMAHHVAGDRPFELWHDKRRIHCSHQGPSMTEVYSKLATALFRGATPLQLGALRA